MLYLPTKPLDIRRARLAAGVLFVVGLALMADLRSVMLGRHVVSAACGLFAGCSAYEPLQKLHVPAGQAPLLGNLAALIAVAVAIAAVNTSPRVGYPVRSLYEACAYALIVVALIVADRMRRA